jgi:NADH:ubiquinone reductase (H+-translocating)
MSTIPHIVIVGGGFAGLWAARALRSAPVRITLLDRGNHHLFQPLLYQVATAGLSAPNIAAPLRQILRRQKNVTVLLGEVSQVMPKQKRLALADARTLDYDYLLLATGATHAYFGHDDWAPYAPGLKTLDDALEIRRRILTAFERAEAEDDAQKRAAWLTFAIVGGGPTGVELAGTLAEIARHTLHGEFRRADPRQARVLLLEAGMRVLSNFPELLSRKARLQLEKLGVEVRIGIPVTAIDDTGVRLGEERIAARTVLWAAGVAASPLARDLDAPLDRAGRVLVQPDLSVPQHPEIFVAGDLASVQYGGKPVPGVAPAAKQMGRHVAHAIRARLQGRPPTSFRYRDFGNLATIGRMAAIVDLHGLKFSGLLAWWFWLAAHVFFLIGFRNRVVVLIDWAQAYWSYQRSARIILGA